MNAGLVSSLKWTILLAGLFAVGLVIAKATGRQGAASRFSAVFGGLFLPPLLAGVITSKVVPGYEESRWLVWWLSLTVFGYALVLLLGVVRFRRRDPDRMADPN